jgi:hypothetical protein
MLQVQYPLSFGAFLGQGENDNKGFRKLTTCFLKSVELVSPDSIHSLVSSQTLLSKEILLVYILG